MKQKANTIKSQVYNAIFSDIINHNFNFDEYLTEKSLMEKYNVSRAPIREALMQLRSDQFIISIPRHGYRIRKPDQQELCDIIKFRSVLECTFLEQFHYLVTPDKIEELRVLCHEYENMPKDMDFITYWKSNCAFHAKLFSCYCNKFALQSLLESMDRQVVYYVESMKNHYLAADLHFAMLDYIEKNDIKTAKTLLQADIEKMPASDLIQNPNKNYSNDLGLTFYGLC